MAGGAELEQLAHELERTDPGSDIGSDIGSDLGIDATGDAAAVARAERETAAGPDNSDVRSGTT
jgi:hypothetical protein